MLGEKCVIIGAPKFDTKMIKNSSQQQKSDKNHQNIKTAKIRKTEKVKK